MIRIFIVLMCWFPFCLAAQSEKAVKCVSGAFIDIIEQKGALQTGLAIDLTKHIGDKLALNIDIEILPFSRALKRVEQGKADCFIGAYYSKQRAEYLLFGQTPIYVDKLNIISRKEDLFQWRDDYADLKGKIVGIMRKAAHGERFDREKAALSTIDIGNSNRQFQLLMLKRLDVIINNPRTSSNVINQLKLKDQITIHWPAVETMPGYYAFSKLSPLQYLNQQFEQEMLQLKASGKLQQLQQQYLAKYQSALAP